MLARVYLCVREFVLLAPSLSPTSVWYNDAYERSLLRIPNRVLRPSRTFLPSPVRAVVRDRSIAIIWVESSTGSSKEKGPRHSQSEATASRRLSPYTGVSWKRYSRQRSRDPTTLISAFFTLAPHFLPEIRTPLSTLS